MNNAQSLGGIAAVADSEIQSELRELENKVEDLQKAAIELANRLTPVTSDLPQSEKPSPSAPRLEKVLQSPVGRQIRDITSTVEKTIGGLGRTIVSLQV